MIKCLICAKCFSKFGRNEPHAQKHIKETKLKFEWENESMQNLITELLKQNDFLVFSLPNQQ